MTVCKHCPHKIAEHSSRYGCSRRSETGVVCGCCWTPRTVAEQLDDAKDGEEFAGVLWKLFAAADAEEDK